MDVAQKTALIFCAAPALLYGDDATIGEFEFRDVDGVGLAVLGKLATDLVVSRAASI